MDKIESLKKIKMLFNDGIITEEEFSGMKNEILSKSNKEIVSPQNKNGVLTLSFVGQWFVFDAKTQLFVNNELHSTHSTKNGFSVKIPIVSDKLIIKVVLMSIKSTIYELEELDNSKSYSLGLIYDNTWGKYSSKFNLTENG